MIQVIFLPFPLGRAAVKAFAHNDAKSECAHGHECHDADHRVVMELDRQAQEVNYNVADNSECQ